MGKNKVKVWFDEEVDILYVSFGGGFSPHSEEVEDNVRLEYGEDGKVIGIEISDISKKLAKPIAKHLAEAVK
ncbi:MAG: DUF2283 domain-containing protein [bacterium]